MLKIQKKISKYNHYKGNNPRFIIIHYVGANSSAKNNVDYFYGGDRQASAHLFVDDNECWQSVEFENSSWHIGNSKTEPNNRNSIGIEMCLVNGQVTDKTEKNTLEITKWLMDKYNIPLGNVRTHAEVTKYGKICPNWQANDWGRWKNFKKKLTGQVIEPSKPSTDNLYRVRKSWLDEKSQKGAYSNKDNAISECKKHSDYKVFDKNGKEVYANESKPTPPKPNKPQGSTKVKKIQNLCNKVLKTNLDVDGIWGGKTEAAVKRLPLCGYKYVNRECTKFVQEILGISVDGIFGRGSENSVKQFQKSKGLSCDGVVGFQTYKALATK